MFKRHGLMLASMTLIVFRSSLACAQVALPNTAIIGKRATEQVAIFPAIDVKSPIFPATLEFEYQEGKISGLTAKYPKQTSYEDVKKTINESQRKWQVAEHHITTPRQFDMTVWRNDDEKIAMQLYADNGGEAQLLVLPFSRDTQTIMRRVQEAAERLHGEKDDSQPGK
jgi:hypothetical protein